MYYIILGLLVFSNAAWARPEYAVKTQSHCIACHASPWGGGPKTVYGKFYGSHSLGLGKYSNQDLFSASVRGLAYYPKHPTQTKSGFALMEASGSANVPIVDESENSGELRTVLTYNMATLGSGAREVYLRYKFHDPLPSPFPKYVLVGRFNAPFGLLTDEHRTYVRQQTNMTLNDFEMGAGVSGDIIPSLVYHFIVVNDFQSGGGFSGKDLQWGMVFNTRWSPSFLPLFIGASQNYQSTLVAPKPHATSVYTAISLDRLTNSSVPATILFEWVTAKNWNNPALNPRMSFFVPATDAAYQSAVAGSQSKGYYGLFRYDLSSRWMLFYKFDYLALNSDFPGDAFSRHGLGFEVFLNSNLILNTRVERAFVLRPELKNDVESAAQDALVAMLRWWI